jgi:hypothetical protein
VVVLSLLLLLCRHVVACTAVALSGLAYLLAEVPLPMAVKHYVYGEQD